MGVGVQDMSVSVKDMGVGVQDVVLSFLSNYAELSRRGENLSYTQITP